MPSLRIGELSNQPISSIAPLSGLVLTVAACFIALIRLYVLDPFITKLYSFETIGRLSQAQLRSFTNHHIAAGSKIVLIGLCAYPLLTILCGSSTPQTLYAWGSPITLGDMLTVCLQIFSAMYIFELFYRDRVSIISCAHHIGAIIIAQAALAMSINSHREKDAIFELMLCFIWGAFDVIAELWPHLAIIIYRTQYSNHRLIAQTFYATAVLEIVGTTVETVIIMWIFGSLWAKWSLALKIVTPFLHVLFSAAQLWGVYIFYDMAKTSIQKTKEEDDYSSTQGEP